MWVQDTWGGRGELAGRGLCEGGNGGFRAPTFGSPGTGLVFREEEVVEGAVRERSSRHGVGAAGSAGRPQVGRGPAVLEPVLSALRERGGVGIAKSQLICSPIKGKQLYIPYKLLAIINKLVN